MEDEPKPLPPLETARELAFALLRVGELRAALEKCAADFLLVDNGKVRYEEIAQEFSLRQALAAEALRKEALATMASEARRLRLD